MKHFSLDLETLSSAPTAAILSIGLYEINGKEDTPNQDRLFYANIDLDSCLKYGLTVSDSSFRWWLKQSNEARQALSVQPIMSLDGAISSLFLWYNKHSHPLANRLWAHATFDFPVLHNAFQRAGYDSPPWHYKECLDLRTMQFLTRPNIRDLKHGNMAEHNASWDAFAQGQMVADTLRLGEKDEVKV